MAADETAVQDRAETLERLRQQMRALLGEGPDGSISEPTEIADPVAFGMEQLLLVQENNCRGSFWLGSKRLLPSEHVGRWCVTGADGADDGRLAELALDSTLAGADLSRALYLDTETTGLGGSGVFAFVVGLGLFREGDFIVEQLVLEGPEQEAASLEYLSRRVAESDLLVTFNGKSFDWPLLAGRYVMNRLPPPPERRHLDLLHVARRIHKERLRRCTLVSLESEVLGFEREGDIGGAEVCSRYLHFLRTGDATGLQAVLDHNYWDVISMAALVSLYGDEQADLQALDFVGIARTLKRSKCFESARAAASHAVSEGAGVKALWTRADIHKALGKKHEAFTDYREAYRRAPDPALRLELVKLLEHFKKQPREALELAQLGTVEKSAAHEKRLDRLRRKARR